MNRKFRYYIPRVKQETWLLFVTLTGIGAAVLSYLNGNVDKATFWLIASLYGFLANKVK